ncbi:MAG: hypothetical protein ED556_14380 [Winogradskyella sp.]|uniref:DUF6913 domain-containing protein n=1 Tax=Winogradskyella sp. TaxID=1883156 RepID=UPI000F41E87A|nr:hypothetical protein [Winogradskyella sp.]RNC79762.1 MAG: hypothetical protein ED556_14380 [Winogradskyella sp.]
MILKAFKEKSNQKYINKMLMNREGVISNETINSVGVLLNESEFKDYEVIEKFFNSIGILSSKLSFFAFSDSKETQHNTWDNIYRSSDFGWRGKLKNIELENFTKTNFDVLICYFLANDIELIQIAAMSKSNFKVGISNEDERLYDLIIEVNPNNFEVFTTELKKYLTILNKL